MKKIQDDNKKITVTVRMPPKMYRQLAQAALFTKRTRSSYIEFSLQNQFEDDELQAKGVFIES